MPPSPDPTDSPTPSPSASDLGWEEIETEMLMLELRGEGLPIEADGADDATNPNGSEPREISDDLDLLRSFAGWAPIDQLHFGPGGLFDCDDPLVLCGNNAVPLGGNSLALVGLQGDDVIQIGAGRDGQLAVAIDRMDVPNSQVGGAFGGADLFLVADLERGTLFELFVQGGNFLQRDTIGRVRVSGDTALFVMPLGQGEEPRYRVIGFERIPVGVQGGERVDTLPSAPWGADSFFDIFYEIPPLGG